MYVLALSPDGTESDEVVTGVPIDVVESPQPATAPALQIVEESGQ